MKKIIFSLLLTILMIFPMGVFASGGISVSPTSLSMEVGQTRTFTITATNAIGDVYISSMNGGVASVSAGEWGTGMVDSGQTKSGTITVTGVGEGTTTIVLEVDAATFDSEDLTGQRTISVTVTKHQETNPVPTTPVVKPNTNNNNNSSNTNTDTNTNTNTETKKEETKSSNSKLKKISVENYELKKVNDNKYTLTVDNKTTMITIKAEAEDSKAKVTGTGLHELKTGENDIEVVITAEDGSTNRIRVVVTREEDEEEVVIKPVEETTEEDDTDSSENPINVIAIVMIALNVILAIAVIALYMKNKKLKESINKIG